jgi:hypothetical protein
MPGRSEHEPSHEIYGMHPKPIGRLIPQLTTLIAVKNDQFPKPEEKETSSFQHQTLNFIQQTSKTISRLQLHGTRALGLFSSVSPANNLRCFGMLVIW